MRNVVAYTCRVCEGVTLFPGARKGHVARYDGMRAVDIRSSIGTSESFSSTGGDAESGGVVKKKGKKKKGPKRDLKSLLDKSKNASSSSYSIGDFMNM
jgi:hypothetical protein